MDSPWMNELTDLLVNNHIRVVCFEFPYMQKRRIDFIKRPPDREQVLLETWLNVYQQFAKEKPFIGGKSMGGRTAHIVSNHIDTSGIVCFGYPLHAPGKNTTTKRITPFMQGQTPMLIHQGTRDPMGSIEDFKTITLHKSTKFLWYEDGDHDLKPRITSGKTQKEHLSNVARQTALFINAR